MRKTINVLAVVFVFTVFLQACRFECHYFRTGIVTKVKGSTVTVVDDKAKHVWDFEGDGFAINDKVKLKFFTNHTDTKIEDDEIVDAKRVD